MAKPNIDALMADVTRARTVMDSATTYITGVPALVQAAKDEVLANGVTEAQLQPLTDVIAGLKIDADEAEAALAANTPDNP